MERVIVVGGPGSGKNTLAQRGASALSALHVELDSIWWQQGGWVHPAPGEFRNAIRDVLDSAPRWVVDGNYIDEIAQSVWPLADTLVWLEDRGPQPSVPSSTLVPVAELERTDPSPARLG